MRTSVSSLIPSASRLAALGVVALSVSACSQTDRFAYDPFSNPFNGKETTGTVSSAPSGNVSSQPLPPPGGYQPTAYAPQQQSYAPYQQQPNYQQQGGYQQSYRAAPPPPPARPAPLPQYTYNAQKGGWGAEGGKTVVVQPGDTAFSLGSRHGIPASAILEANNLPPGSQLTAGQRVVIPGYRGQSAPNQNASLDPRPSVEKPRAFQPAANGRSHIVQPGETLFSISRKYDVTARELADANSVDLSYHVQIGQKVTVPGNARMTPAVHRYDDQQPKVQQPVYRAEQRTTSQEPTPAPQDDYTTTSTTTTQTTGGTDFRWPVRGRVISGFGGKPNGQTNDGVNIAVPEGTEIKASEGGVVAYAGNELKGFGNLVLIRHAGEWVTAYAHASEVLVKRGDVVRRGQVIARAGKTGNVSSPQLHFEVRRGASPVDPLNHLPQG